MSGVVFRVPTEVEIAERIARSAHEGQVDKVGAPYILHVERVAGLVRAGGGDDTAEAAAWLHDVIEDTDWTRELLVHRAGISPTVADAVMLLSKNRGTETYAEYINRLAWSGNRIAIRVKVADLLDHLDPNCPPHLRPRYERALPILQAALASERMELDTLAG